MHELLEGLHISVSWVVNEGLTQLVLLDDDISLLLLLVEAIPVVSDIGVFILQDLVLVGQPQHERNYIPSDTVAIQALDHSILSVTIVHHLF